MRNPNIPGVEYVTSSISDVRSHSLVNDRGQTSFLEVPLVEEILGWPFPVSLLFPVGQDPSLTEGSLSICWSLSLVSGSVVLKRPCLPDLPFAPVENTQLYVCRSTGQIVESTEDGLILREGGVKYVFPSEGGGLSSFSIGGREFAVQRTETSFSASTSGPGAGFSIEFVALGNDRSRVRLTRTWATLPEKVLVEAEGSESNASYSISVSRRVAATPVEREVALSMQDGTLTASETFAAEPGRSEVLSVSLVQSETLITATVGQRVEETTISMASAKTVRVERPDGSVALYGLCAGQSGPVGTLVCSAVTDRGEASSMRFDQDGAPIESSDPTDLRAAGSQFRSMSGGASDFSGGWSLTGAAHLEQDGPFALPGALGGGWVGFGTGGNAARAADSLPYPGEPTLLAALVVCGGASVSIGVDASTSLGQESISSTLPASECPEGCLRLVCLPVELSGTPSSASVWVSSGACHLKSFAWLRGLTASRFSRDFLGRATATSRGGVLSGSYYDGSSPFSESDPGGGRTIRDPETGLPTLSVDDLGDREERAYLTGEGATPLHPLPLSSTTSAGGLSRTSSVRLGRLTLEPVFGSSDGVSTSYGRVESEAALNVTRAIGGRFSSETLDTASGSVSFSLPSGQTQYRTESMGLVTSLSDLADSFSFGSDSLRRLSEVSYPWGATSSYAYEEGPFGRLSSGSSYGSTTSFLYDALDRPTLVSEGSGPSARSFSFSYDGASYDAMASSSLGSSWSSSGPGRSDLGESSAVSIASGPQRAEVGRLGGSSVSTSHGSGRVLGSVSGGGRVCSPDRKSWFAAMGMAGLARARLWDTDPLGPSGGTGSGPALIAGATEYQPSGTVASGTRSASGTVCLRFSGRSQYGPFPAAEEGRFPAAVVSFVPPGGSSQVISVTGFSSGEEVLSVSVSSGVAYVSGSRLQGSPVALGSVSGGPNCVVVAFWSSTSGVAVLNGVPTALAFGDAGVQTGASFFSVGRPFLTLEVHSLAYGHCQMGPDEAVSLCLSTMDSCPSASSAEPPSGLSCAVRRIAFEECCLAQSEDRPNLRRVPLNGSLGTTDAAAPSKVARPAGVGVSPDPFLSGARALSPAPFAFEPSSRRFMWRAFGRGLSYACQSPGGLYFSALVRPSPVQDGRRRVIAEARSGASFLSLFARSGRLFVSTASGEVQTSLSLPDSAVSRVSLKLRVELLPLGPVPVAEVYVQGSLPWLGFVADPGLGQSCELWLGSADGGADPMLGLIGDVWTDGEPSRTLDQCASDESAYGACLEEGFDALGRRSYGLSKCAGRSVDGSFIYGSDQPSGDLSRPCEVVVSVDGSQRYDTVLGYGPDGLLSCVDSVDVKRDRGARVAGALGQSVTYDRKGNVSAVSGLSGVAPSRSITFSEGQTGLLVSSATVGNRVRSYAYPTPNHGLPSSISTSGPGYSSTLSLSWSGRRLASATVGQEAAEYTYGPDGFLASRRSGASVRGYAFSEDGRLLSDLGGPLEFHYVYFPSGAPGLAVTIDGNGVPEAHLVVQDALGRIAGLASSSGGEASYAYDLWGIPSLVSDTTQRGVGSANKLLFVGYLYDDLLGTYALGVRHYDPVVCRFVEPDGFSYLDPSSVDGLNPFAYCAGDPLTYVDPTGTVPIVVAMLLIAVGAGAAIGATSNVITQYISNDGWDNFNWALLGWNTIVGAASGALAMSTLGPWAMVFANAGLAAVGSVGNHLISGDDFGCLGTWGDIMITGFIGGFAGLLGGPGALYKNNVNAAASQLTKAANSYIKVISKASSGGYATTKGANIALGLTRNNLIRAFNTLNSRVALAGGSLFTSIRASAFVEIGEAFVFGLWNRGR